MPVEFPPALPGVQLSTYANTEDNAFRSNDTEIGPPAYELLSEDVPSVFNVQWKFSSFQLQLFESWYKNAITKGVQSFDLTLPVGAGDIEHECYFVNAPNNTKIGGINVVSAQLLAIQKQYNSEPEYEDLLELSELGMGFDTEQTIRFAWFLASFVIPENWESLDYGTDYS